MRSFISMDIPEKLKKDIRKIQNELEKKNLFQGKFTESENLHLTLKFLGEIEDRERKEIENRLELLELKKFKTKFGKIGVFSERFIKIIWIELVGKKVFELQNKIDEKLEGLFQKEQRFMSHLTIARVKKVKDKNLLLKCLNEMTVPEKEFSVSEIKLKKSTLREKGPVYEDILVKKLG